MDSSQSYEPKSFLSFTNAPRPKAVPPPPRQLDQPQSLSVAYSAPESATPISMAAPPADAPPETRHSLSTAWIVANSATVGVWVCAEITTVWWAMQTYALNNARGASGHGTLPNVLDNYLGVPFTCAWLIIAFFSQIVLFIIMMVSSDLFAHIMGNEPPATHVATVGTVLHRGSP